MRFYEQKSWLLGILAILAPIPLPLNEVVGWTSVGAFMLAALLFLHRTSRGIHSVLPYWAMNLLGAAYIPFLLTDLTVLRTGKVLQPLVHLALFSMAVKLFALRREKDKWHLLLGLFFLFVASMGTSVHPAVVLYLGAFATLAALTLIRFAGLNSVSTLLRSSSEPRVPLRRFLTGTILLSVAAAVPLFFFLPRLRQPYVYVPAGGSGGAVQVSGFSDRLDLGMIDRVRSLRTVVFRFAYETPAPPLTEMRFKIATYEVFTEDGWRRERSESGLLRRKTDGFFHLHEFRPISWMKIWLRRGNDRIPIPVETTRMDLPTNAIVVDETGGTRLLFPKPGTVEYRAGLAAEPVVPSRSFVRSEERDVSRVTPRMAELARTVMGEGDLEERIQALANHLQRQYSYSLDDVNRGPRPLESFLFETRRGHCEYFASAMVLLLRSQGVPARLATGYLGADYNPLEEYMIVRQANAHAWVEAFVPEAGGAAAGEPVPGRWVIFDPTPADARPQTGRPGWATLLSQAYDYLVFRWDRYVLTYGFGDQVDVFVKLRDVWLRFWRSVQPEEGPEQEAEQETPEQAETDSVEIDAGEEAGTGFSVWRAMPLLLVFVAAGFWFWLQRERFSATKAYRILRARAEPDQNGKVPIWLGPLKVEESLRRRYPQAAEETRVIVSHYLRESFAGERLTESQLAEVKGALAAARPKLKARRTLKKTA
ncbi:MAG: transglutaminaseTgpA domain-containing protein [Thermoanaerobaculia bacterium]